jgi:tRNA pseudouridine65 synthase
VDEGPARLEPPAPGAAPRLPVLYEDERLLAVHKPSGLHTHPSALSPGEGSAARWLAQQSGHRVWPVHRLDRGASGLLLFARSAEAARDLITAFRQRRVGKVYLALVRGWPQREDQLLDEGEIDRPLRDLDPASQAPALQEALTRWRVLARAEAPFCGGRGAHAFPTTRLSLLECRPATGRMHQIRRHLAGLGHPLLGDGQHGDRHLNRILAEQAGLERLALVCVELSLPGGGGGNLCLRTALDPDLRRVLARLGLPDPTAHRSAEDLYDGVLVRPGRAWRRRAARTQALADGSPGPAPRPPRPLRPWSREEDRPAACPLCAGPSRPFHEEDGRRWRSCPTCALVHRERASWPAPEEVAARLALHRNRGEDAGYRAWLQPLVEALRRRLPPGARGLDAGSGPRPVLAGLLAEAGLPAAWWDPLFQPLRPAPPAGGWDYITFCEVFEHLASPLAALEELGSGLRPGGWLALSTGLLAEDGRFPGWWYARDPTHIVFARPATLDWLAARLGWRLERAGRLALFQRPES